MSQEKVEQKKKDRANRKKTVVKKKIEYRVSIIVACVLALGVAGWIGYSIYGKYQDYQEANKTYEYFELSTEALDDYMATLSE